MNTSVLGRLEQGQLGALAFVPKLSSGTHFLGSKTLLDLMEETEITPNIGEDYTTTTQLLLSKIFMNARHALRGQPYGRRVLYMCVCILRNS